jgi:AraC-like DNA-binding protein
MSRMSSLHTHASWNFPRSSAGARLMLQLAQEHGLDADTALDGTGLNAALLADPKADIPASAELALIERLVRHLPHVAGLGLIAGTRYHVTTYGIWGYALLSSPTLRSAARLALRYLNLTYAFTQITMDERDGRATFTLHDLEVPASVRRFVVERDASAIVTLQHDLFNRQIPLRELRLKGAPPPYAEQVAARFGVVPRYHAEANQAVFASEVLDLPLPQANEHTAALCEDLCRELMQQRQARSGVAAQVRNRLLQAPAQMPDMATVADALCVTPRTLRRHLLAEGTTFRDLVDEVRHTLATELMAAADSPDKDIAQRLGFNDLSAFIQAFKRWRGVTPSAYRQEMGQPARFTRRGR